jgi:hypothetical protein
MEDTLGRMGKEARGGDGLEFSKGQEMDPRGMERGEK